MSSPTRSHVRSADDPSSQGLEQGSPFLPFSDYYDTFSNKLTPNMFADRANVCILPLSTSIRANRPNSRIVGLRIKSRDQRQADISVTASRRRRTSKGACSGDPRTSQSRDGPDQGARSPLGRWNRGTSSNCPSLLRGLLPHVCTKYSNA